MASDPASAALQTGRPTVSPAPTSSSLRSRPAGASPSRRSSVFAIASAGGRRARARPGCRGPTAARRPPTRLPTDHAAADHNVGAPARELRRARPGANAEELAKAHAATDATLPPVPAGDLVKVHMTLKDMVVEIAPGVKYNTWAFDGHGAPGPIVHVREGQTVEMTLTNGGAIPHSIDFHAARIAPNVAFRDVAPGDSFTFRFKAATRASSCTTAARSRCSRTSRTGCTARSSSRPATPLPKADKEYVLVASEWYLNGDGIASRPRSTWRRRARRRPTGRPSTATRTSTSRIRSPPTRARPSASTSSPPARRSTRTSTSSARSSTAPGSTAT